MNQTDINAADPTMGKCPHDQEKIACRYVREFLDEAVKLVIEDVVSVYNASRQPTLPKSTLENWVGASTKSVNQVREVVGRWWDDREEARRSCAAGANPDRLTTGG